MKKKKVILTKHAEERALQRGISLEEIKQTIDKPSKSSPTDRNIYRFERIVKVGTHIVIGEMKGNHLVIISTWIKT